MTLYGADGKSIPPIPPTRKQRFFRRAANWWKAVPKVWKGSLGVLAAIGIILTAMVRIDDIWLIFHRPKPTSANQNSPAKPTNEAVVQMRSEYIQGTEFTHKELQETFPFGYTIIYAAE